MALTIPDICVLFDRHGGRMYSGEPVTQLAHALQTAHAAEMAGADAALITAALLHDLGHLLNDQGETPTARGIDDVHQYFALPFLRPLFDDDVLEPIRLHVEAKRYLCATRPGYHDAPPTRSAASRFRVVSTRHPKRKPSSRCPARAPRFSCGNGTTQRRPPIARLLRSRISCPSWRHRAATAR